VRIDAANAANNACFLTGHNSSSQIVVAWRMDITIASPSGTVPWIHRHDHFFKDQDLLLAMSPPPNADYSPIDIDCSILTGGFESQTLWVQFIDGSTWGDADAQSYMMAERTNAVKLLETLKAAHASGGEKAFTQALTSFDSHKPNMQESLRLNEAHSTQLRLEQMTDIKSQLAEVDRMLYLARLRANWMK
jgi:hypothetical protein